MHDKDPLQVFIDLSVSGMQELGCIHFGSPDATEAMEKAGFVNVRLMEVAIPIGTWPEDLHQKYIGTVMKALFSESLDAYAAKPFEAIGVSSEERKRLIAWVTKSLEDTRIHRYLNLRFCFGQKGPPPLDSIS